MEYGPAKQPKQSLDLLDFSRDNKRQLSLNVFKYPTAFSQVISLSPNTYSCVSSPISKSSHKRNLSDFSTAFSQNEADPPARDIDRIIENCDKMQNTLVTTWSDLKNSFHIRSNSLGEIKYDKNLVIDPELARAKKKFMTIKQGVTDPSSEMIRKIKSILSVSNLTTDNKTAESTLRHYLTRDDLSNTTTAKLLSKNKRQFGKPFDKGVKMTNKNHSSSPRKIPINNVCPELTVIEDIKLLKKQESFKHLDIKEIKLIKPETVVEKADEDIILYKFYKAPTVYKYAVDKILKEKPNIPNEINKSKQKTIKKKINNYEELLNNLEATKSKTISPKNKTSTRQLKRVSNMTVKLTNRKIKDDNIFQDIRKKYSEDIETKKKIHEMSKLNTHHLRNS
ncbi:unnamed protein product [Blepharisma stoltei]|uniref:Uncharacterized protein n=1 Tax=Blepharisma stoltei TaxID=1481888 RepID=A0AAU9JK43_9CILI|nr:unnamed protein product [Blepharisma stoltei]